MLVVTWLLVVGAIPLVAVWCGYPAVTIWLARRLPDVDCTSGTPVPISVVIATRDHPDVVRARVLNVLECSYPRDLMTIIVAVDARVPDLSEYCTVLRGVAEVIRGDPPGGKASALNAGVRAASGRLVVLADSHQRFTDETLLAFAGYLERGPYGAATGVVIGAGSTLDPRRRGGLHTAAPSREDELPGSDVVRERPPRGRGNAAHSWGVSIYEFLESRVRRAQARLHSVVTTSGAVTALRKELWEPLPAGLICDDLYLAMRLAARGYRVGYCDRAEAHELRVLSKRQLFRKKVRTLTGLIQFVRWVPDSLRPLRNPIWAHFVFHKVMRLATPILLTLLAAGVILGAATEWRSVAIPVSGVVGLAIVVATLIRPKAVAAVGHILFWDFALLWAPLWGLYYGLRGHWEVWQAQPSSPPDPGIRIGPAPASRDAERPMRRRGPSQRFDGGVDRGGRA